MKKIMRNLIIIVLTVIVSTLGVFYARDFRYSEERGVYKILERGSDYTAEEREEMNISENYEFRITHLDLETIIALF